MADRIVSPFYGSKRDCNPRGWGVVGPVRQVDFGMHPYPPHLLPEPASAQGPTSLGLVGQG
jgi:hypothetical protein